MSSVKREFNEESRMNENTRYYHAVTVLKQAIEQIRYRVVKAGNAELLSLYYGIGRYVSKNTREGVWGTDAIGQISKQLQQEIPGLRGYSETNIKCMRLFYESWMPYVKRQPSADEMEVDGKMLLMEILYP